MFPAFLSSTDFFLKIFFFSKNSFKNTISVKQLGTRSGPTCCYNVQESVEDHSANTYRIYTKAIYLYISFNCARQIKIARLLGLHYNHVSLVRPSGRYYNLARPLGLHYNHVSLVRPSGRYYNLARPLGLHYNHYVSPSIRVQFVKMLITGRVHYCQLIISWKTNINS